jgi:hypothetical protein
MSPRTSPPHLAPRKVLVLTARTDYSIADIRMRMPLQSLADAGSLSLTMRAVKDASLNDIHQADVVIVQREATPLALRWAHLARELGRPLVFEIDDLLTQPERHLQHHDTIAAHVPRMLHMLALADRVSVSTLRLLAALPAAVHAKAKVTPNYGIPPDGPPAAQGLVTEAAPLTLVIASSDAMAMDALILSLKQVQAAQQQPCRILALGAMGPLLASQLHHVVAHPVMPLDAFKRLIAAQTNPIGLIPLDDSRFSACKSAVKYFDFSLCGLPVVASALPPYSDVITHGQDGWLVAPQAQDWTDAIHTLAASPELRQRLVSRAAAQVHAHHSLAHTTEAWQHLLDSLPPARPLRPSLRALQLRLQDQWLLSAQQALRRLNERRKSARRPAR